VDASARVDALDDLLAEVATLGEVKGAGLAGLLREVAVRDICAVAGRAGEDAGGLRGQRARRDGSGGDEVRGERGDGCGVGPELSGEQADCGAWIRSTAAARQVRGVS